MGWANENLSLVFYHLGGFLAQQPRRVMLTFALISLVLGTGLVNFTYENDTEDLFTVINGDSKQERAIFEKLFPTNYSNRFDPSRATHIGRFARIIITAANEENLLRGDIWQEILHVDDEIHKVTIEWKHQYYNYSNLCAKWFDACFENEYLEIAPLVEDFEAGKGRLSYPVLFHPQSFKAHVLAQYIGGVSMSDDGFSIKSARAVILNYALAVNNEEEKSRGQLWEEEVLRVVETLKNSLKTTKVLAFTFETLATELDKNIFSVIEPFIFTIVIAAAFVLFSCSSSDCVKSKSLLGLTAIVAACLGALAAVGFLCYFGVPFIGVNVAIPFILLGIGVDDSFVIMAAWSKTSVHDSVGKRMSECFADAAVSITITTLTDALSFFVGLLTPIRCIQLFSLYSGTGVLFIFVWQVFFFGSAVAISGECEAENRHSVFWWIQATPKSKSGSMSSLNRLFFTGGVDKDDPNNPKDFTEDMTIVFFRDYFAPFICKTYVKIAVLCSFVLYLMISYHGISQLKEGLILENLARDDSYMQSYMAKETQYFREYPYRLQVAITNTIDYSSKANQNTISRLFEKLTSMEYMSVEFSENWLRSFLTFTNNYKELYDFNITTETEFISFLREYYLTESSVFSQDVVFNNDLTHITASRFILQVVNIKNFENVPKFIEEVRRTTREFKNEGLEITVNNPWMSFADQFIIIESIAIQLVTIALVIVMLVTFVLIPNFKCCVCVFLSLISVEMGLVGCMGLWGVRLDIISVIGIMMGIGFSVDFIAHISYSFVTSTADSAEEKVRDAMYSLGKPIMQGAISTWIALIALVFIPSYIFQSYFKVFFLIILFATFHSLFLLPVVLTMLGPVTTVRLPWVQSKSYNVDNLQNAKLENSINECYSSKTVL